MSLTLEQRQELINRAGRAGTVVADGINLLAQQNATQTAAIAALQNAQAVLAGRVETTEGRADAAEARLTGHDADLSAVFTAITGNASGAEATDANGDGTADVNQSSSGELGT